MKRSLLLFTSYVGAALTVLALDVAQAHAVGSIGQGANSARGIDQPVDLFGDTGVFSKISSVLLFIVGAIAVIMIVIGGIKYTISQGDSSAITSAKNTILYSVIGLVVAILAYAIVNFVVDRLT